MIETKYLIIGNGVAGMSAAQEIRRLDPEGRLLVASDEGEPYYYRASLSEWISGDTSDEMVPARTERFYQDMDIEVLGGHVEQIDPQARRAFLRDGQVIAWEKLCIATGAQANVFPIQGLDDPLAFRTLADARRIKERLGCCGRALIVGGGVLGLELAGALHEMGIDRIAVAQRSGHVGKPLLDPPAAEWLQARMVADGVDLFLDDTVERVEPVDASVANGRRALFHSGKSWVFDILVQAVGITPTFPAVAELEVGRGIRIDGASCTNLPHVYAAGDCTETRQAGGQWETTRIWLDGARQGRMAGTQMAGGHVEAPDQAFFNASLLYTAFYAYIGEPHGQEGQTHIWQGQESYRKFRVVDGRLAGALLLGDRRGSSAIMEAMGQPVAAYGAQIARPDFPYNELTGEDWDYLFW